MNKLPFQRKALNFIISSGLIHFENVFLVLLRRLLRASRGKRVDVGDISTKSKVSLTEPRVSSSDVPISLLQKNMIIKGVPKDYNLVSTIEHDEHILRAIYFSLKEGDHFWDIGANIGIYSVLLSVLAKNKDISIVAFEPEERCCAILEEIKRQNGLENITLYPMALGSKTQSLKMTIAKNPIAGTHSLLLNNQNFRTDEQGQTVTIETGDHLRAQYGLQVPAVIKVDVEGYELEVLKGLDGILRDPGCQSIICEIHFAILDTMGGNLPQAIVEYLKNRGFTYKKWLGPSHLHMSKC